MQLWKHLQSSWEFTHPEDGKRWSLRTRVLQPRSSFPGQAAETGIIRLGRFPTFSICWCKELRQGMFGIPPSPETQSVAGGSSCSMKAQALTSSFLGEWQESVVPGQSSWRHPCTALPRLGDPHGKQAGHLRALQHNPHPSSLLLLPASAAGVHQLKAETQ